MTCCPLLQSLINPLSRTMTTFVRITQEQKNVALIQQTTAKSNFYALFNKSNPNKLQAGAIVQVCSSLSTSEANEDPKKHIKFAGIVLGVQYKGIDTSIRVRNYILKTGVEQVFKVYSPLITDIKVLSPKASPKFTRNKLYYLRDHPKLVKWDSIDELVKAHTSATSKSSSKKS